jgi:hypothetical protein
MPVPGSQNGRPRPAKAETIHGLVRVGDLAGVQRKLRENPAFLNDKNPVVRASCAPPILSSRLSFFSFRMRAGSLLVLGTCSVEYANKIRQKK